MPVDWRPRTLHTLDEATIEALCDVLIDCVEGGASVSFMLPFTRERARAFWRKVAQGVAAGERALLVADDGHGICGTVQLVLDQPENQPHRADLSKMLVHRRARRQGLGEALMRAAEVSAREHGKTLLVLDTVTGSIAARLYERLGWQRVGDIPGYALLPAGGPCATTYYYRELPSAPALQRRPATPADVPFLLELRRQTMSEHQRNAGLVPSDEERQTRVLVRYECAEILEHQGRPVGLLKLARDGLEWDLIQIQLVPELQGRGIGGVILQGVIDEARRAGAALQLSVLVGSRARRLYERCGFVVVGQGAHATHMRLA